MVSPFLRRHAIAFPAVARSVGTEIWHAGAADLVDITEDDAEATVVEHGITYRVHLRAFEDTVDRTYQCSCRPTAPTSNCRHAWAVLLEVDQLLSEIEAAEARTGSGPIAARRGAGSAPQERATWQRRLAPLAVPAARPLTIPPVIEYYVQAGSLLGDAPLTIHVRERLPKKNGELGHARAGRLAEETVERLPRLDRVLLGLMQSASRRPWYGTWSRRSDTMSLASPWLVSHEDAPAVLPLLAQSDRVYLAPVPPADTPARRITIDVETPFTFELVPVPGRRATDAFEVHGIFRRGEVGLHPRPGRLADTDYTIVEDRLIRTECHGATALLAELAHRGPLAVPAAELPQMLGLIAQHRGARHFLAHVLDRLPASKPQGVVMVTFPKSAELPLRATVAFDYQGEIVQPDDERPLVQGEGGALRRDFDAERALREGAASRGLTASMHGGFEFPRDRLGPIVDGLGAAGFRVLAEGKRLRMFRRASASVRSGIDWFELQGNVEFDEHKTNLPELLRGKVTVEGFVELDDGTLGVLPAAWLARIERLRLLGGEPEGEGMRVPSSRALLLDAMLAAVEPNEIAIDAEFTRLRARLAQFTAVRAVEEPRGFVGTLRPYQREGLGWLRFLDEFGLGGCLADDMGLGKTVQVLALLVARTKHGPRRGDARPSLLVAPRSVLANWRAEAERFAPNLRVVDFSGPQRWQEHGGDLLACDLVLTTYGIVRADAPQFVERAIEFDHAILDEAQAIKNPDSVSAKAVRLLRARRRLVLTGTPVENHLGDLWSLFEFLNPGMLGRLPAFRALFGKDTGDAAAASHRELVQRALRPVLLRRTKSQVLQDLPEKIEQTVWCELGPEQRKRYDALRRHYQKKLLAGSGELGNEQRFLVLEALLRLRQAACHEGLLVKSRRSAESAKFEDLLARLVDLAAEGHKALVFSQFTTLLDLLEPALRARGIAWERLDGSTRNRAEHVARFQEDPQCPVFLISLKAGGYGLNLTAASYVFLLDPWWNPAVEMQAIDRAHRIGQKRVVNAYRLVCRDTVEERVLDLQAKKKALCEAILGNDRSLLQDLTRADLELLLG